MAVWRVHLQRVAGGASGTLELSPALLHGLADLTEGFSGAEIEQAVVAGLFEAYASRRPLAVDDLHAAVRTTVPLSVTSSEQIARLRAWADVRAVAATATDDRAAYDVSTAQQPAPPERPGGDLRRGGRTVDF